MIRVAIVEDDEDIRTYLKEIILSTDELCLVGAFSDAETFRAGFDNLNAEVVLMDIHLPGENGIECVKKLKPLSEKTQYLMCTIFEDNDSIFESICAGATGYLLKNSDSHQIKTAIKEIHSGGSPMSSIIARKIVAHMSVRESPKPEFPAILSLREREILELLTKGFRYKEIADKLFISTETVRTHIRNIYQKLQVNSRTEAMNKLLKK